MRVRQTFLGNVNNSSNLIGTAYLYSRAAFNFIFCLYKPLGTNELNRHLL
ncbi:hypothetical protein SAMN05444008_114117 [Cnuella takakiae]|uniref:Uncharacterized protein n=1 Tax=Cnuella takakiae TaxID=1302690 RepID=A0A1M5FRR7_9BACT|nr:hypothetical protein SAMN05444008_114117 [Cnuella takakiae]